MIILFDISNNLKSHVKSIKSAINELDNLAEYFSIEIQNGYINANLELF